MIKPWLKLKQFTLTMMFMGTLEGPQTDCGGHTRLKLDVAASSRIRSTGVKKKNSGQE